ncbi:hypothetical protein [Vibrio vulnificus]|uniref:hypothetical protein n=1 Tax=Vibrio vulnificus TaxID=672 RepID=UPI000A369934|nr:hypothetical protein [Vibrio vulnificus]OUD79140.1 putative membrane protein [Vibrio vulnificus]
MKYTVLKLGGTTQFESERVAVDRFINSGYKFVCEIEAADRVEAQKKYSNEHKATNEVAGELKNPASYLKVCSTIFMTLSIVGCLILVLMGFEVAESYRTRDFAVFYFVGAAASLLVTLLIHSISKTLIYIANKVS